MGAPLPEEGALRYVRNTYIISFAALFIVLRRTANLNPEPINLNPYFFALSSSSFFSSLSFGRRT